MTKTIRFNFINNWRNLTFVISLFGLLLFVLQECDFSSKEKIIKVIETDKITLKWVEVSEHNSKINYYRIYVRNKFKKEVICESNNILDVEVNKDTIKISFFEKPHKNFKPIIIPETVFEYFISINVE